MEDKQSGANFQRGMMQEKVILVLQCATPGKAGIFLFTR